MIRFQKNNISLSGALTHKSINFEQIIFRAGIEKYFCLYFGANENSKKSFWNYLTFGWDNRREGWDILLDGKYFEKVIETSKEVQIVATSSSYLLHVLLNYAQPASNVGGLVIHWTDLNWLDIAITRNNLFIISIALEASNVCLLLGFQTPKQIWTDIVLQKFHIGM